MYKKFCLFPFKKKKKKSNAIAANYFTTFLQNVDVANLLLVFI